MSSGDYRIIDNFRTLAIHDGHLTEKMFEAKLYESLYIPSTIHAYSCAIEYMKDWFLSKFRKDYFKYTYVNGKNLYMDFKQFNKEQMMIRQCPMLAVIPTLNTDFDNDFGSLYELPTNIWRRKRNHSTAFFQDKTNNIFIAMEPELMEMNFTFKIRVESRAQQLDLWNYMKMNLRVGATNTEYISIDFHIPQNVLFTIAELTNFKIIKDEDNNPVRIVDPYKFLSYLNSNSAIPITYKMRSINGKSEFFVRIPDVPMHIKMEDKISLDDGEARAMINNKFHLEFNTRLRIPCPKYYVLYSTSDLYKNITFTEDSIFGLHNIKIVEVPEVNLRGWNQFINTEWTEDEVPKEYPYKIGVSPLFENREVNSVIVNSLNMGYSPSTFLDFHVFNDGNEIPIKMEYNSIDDINIVIENNVNSPRFFIVIYIDLEFVNNEIITINNLNGNRIN